MARRCGCASDSCSCEIVGGEGVVVTGAGSPRNPYIVSSTVADIETGIDIQYNNVDVIRDVHQIDFRGSAITITPGTDEAVVTVTVPDPVSGYSVPVGAIWMFGAGTPPTGWLMCDGTTKLIADYPNLFAVISNRYGGDGTVNFKVPNLTDRFPIGASATKPANELGGGSASKAIAAGNLPPHTHDISHGHAAANTNYAGNHDHEIRLANAAGGQVTVARGSASFATPRDPIADDGAHVHSVTVPAHYGSSGGGDGLAGAALDIMPPWLAMAFIIKA
jgi:microcystin-dependent protein